MSGYSVAIRTLGKGGDKFRRELESIHRQTVTPDRIVVYIARGYNPPQWRVGREEYVFVDKGMVAQRALPYSEIQSKFVLLLDDDVELQDDSAAILLDAMGTYGADCIAADTFHNQDMPARSKILAFLLNWTYPRRDDGWAFKITSTGTFSYNNAPKEDICKSQNAAGPASMWRKDAFMAIHYEAERWLDDFSFAYGDEMLYFYKAYVNGYKLFVHYKSGIVHLDGRTESSRYKADPDRLLYRAMIPYILWHRTLYSPACVGRIRRHMRAVTYAFKIGWLGMAHVALSVASFSLMPIINFIKGTARGMAYVRTQAYRALPDFCVK